MSTDTSGAKPERSTGLDTDEKGTTRGATAATRRPDTTRALARIFIERAMIVSGLFGLKVQTTVLAVEAEAFKESRAPIEDEAVRPCSERWAAFGAMLAPIRIT